MKRRILSFVLCLAMLVGMIPTSVFATETEETAHTCAWTYTPTEDGTQHIATCEDCGESYTEDHTLEDGQCTLCHWISEASQETTLPETQETEAPETTAAAEETEATDATEATEAVCLHENTQEVAEIPATCTAPGKTAGVVCADCGCYVSGGEELPQLPHTFEEGVCTQCQYVCPHEQTETREESEDCCAGTYCLLCGMLLPEEESDLPYGFLGMPQEYTLSADQVESKAFLVDNDCLTTLGDLEEGVDYVENSIMFWAETEEEAQAIAAAYNAELTSYGCMVGVATLQGATVAQALEVAMTPDNGMPAVDPIYISVIEPLPNLPYYESNKTMAIGVQAPVLQLWENFKDGDPYLSDPSSNEYQWYHDMVNTYEAWGVTQGAGVTVAVLDTGVSTSHVELSGKVTVVSNSYFLSSLSGDHGTHVAGIIAAKQGNGYGGAGVAPEADILSINVATSSGSITNDTLARAIQYAASYGADIINMSLGGIYSSSSSTVQSAVNYAYERNVSIFAAMGNEHTNSKCSPACLKHVIAITAVNKDGYLADFSNYGSWADLAAPGQDIMSSTPNSYEIWDGTSMATPVAAGVAALYISALGYNPGPDKVEAALKKAATKGYGSSQMGKGIVNAANLFSSDRSAPYISLNSYYSLNEASDAEYQILDAMTSEERDELYASAFYSADNTTNASNITEDARASLGLYIYPRTNATNGEMLVITTDGTNPAMKNGIVTNGLCYDTNGYGIRFKLDNFPTRTKITIKAAYVSGMGVMSSISTISFTITPSDYNYPSSVSITAISGTTLTPGKSASFSAVVEPYSDVSQSVVWSIVSAPYAPGAKVNSAGVLTTKKTDSGSITLRAASKNYPGVYDQITINLKALSAVKSITLNTSSLTLGYSAGRKYGYFQLEATIRNALGQNVSGSSSYSVSWKSSNPKVITVDETGMLTAHSLGKATITCTANDGSKKSAKCTVTVVTPPEAMTITGQETVVPGKSITYKVDVYPSAASKKVNWSLTRSVDGVSISNNGVLKVSKSAATGKFITIQAKSVTGSVTATKSVYIYKATEYVKIAAGSNNLGIKWTYRNDSFKSLVNVYIYSADIADTAYNDQCFQLKSYVTNSAEVLWSSSNPSVASVSSTGYVTGHKAGTATITCKANDGSGKKATVKIIVSTPASYVTVKSNLNTLYSLSGADSLSDVYDDLDSINMYTLATGKSATHKATLGDTYGKPSSAKVKWSFKVYRVGSSGTYDYTNYAKNNKLVSITSSGKLSVSSKMQNTVNSSYYKYYVFVFATAEYALHNVVGGVVYRLVKPTTTLRFPNSTLTYYTYQIGSGYRLYFYDNSPLCNFTVSSSNPAVVNVMDTVGYDSSRGMCYVDVHLAGKGTAKLTVKAQDGSGKSASVTIKIK